MAYNQIPISPEDAPKTAVTTTTNAVVTFQRFINKILRDLSFVFCYIDDILIASAYEILIICDVSREIYRSYVP